MSKGRVRRSGNTSVITIHKEDRAIFNIEDGDIVEYEIKRVFKKDNDYL